MTLGKLCSLLSLGVLFYSNTSLTKSPAQGPSLKGQVFGGGGGGGGRQAPGEEVGETHSRCAPRIVEEVRSIRFNQEQEEELLHRHLSRSQDFETGSSVDIREVAQEQDLITALVNRERVCHPLSAQSVIALPFHPCPASRLLQIWPASCHLRWAVSLDATLSFSERS